MQPGNDYRWIFSLALMLGLWGSVTQSPAAEPPLGPLGVVENNVLSAEDASRIGELERVLSESGRGLRTQLRALRLRMPSAFNSIHIFRIERHMGKVQTDIKRMGRLSRGGSPVVMPLRIVVDDLQRQLDGLRQEQNSLMRQLDNNEEVGGGEIVQELVETLNGYIGTVAEALEIGHHALQ